MAKFYDVIGYAEEAVETAPSVWKDVIVEHKAYGDVLSTSAALVAGDKVNQDLKLDVTISIVRDAYIGGHFHTMRYVKYQGVRWNVSNVKLAGVRLEFRLGSVYNGPFPS